MYNINDNDSHQYTENSQRNGETEFLNMAFSTPIASPNYSRRDPRYRPRHLYYMLSPNEDDITPLSDR